MNLTYQRRRLADFARGARLFRELEARERWPQERLREYQQERLDEIVRHATAHSPFYRERIGKPSGRVDLASLPTLDKATMMENFDRLVTDDAVRSRDALLAHVETVGDDALYAGGYRAMTTSG